METWQYEPALDLDQSLIERLRRFPREPDMLSYGVRSVCAITIRSWLKTYHRLKMTGLENIPATGSFVMVANHASHLDALCLLSALPLRRLHQAFPAAAADYFFKSVPRVALAVFVVNALPFQRQTHVRQSMNLCRELLANPGNILVIFPEGTRSASGKISAFKPGIASLVAGTDVPVLPCYLDGTHAAMPKGAWMPRPRPIRLMIGRPRSFRDSDLSKASLAQMCESLHQAVVELRDLDGGVS